MGILLTVLLTGCGSSLEDEAEDLFRTCIEEGGGSVGDVVLYVEEGELVVVQGPVDAPGELSDRCFESTNQQLAEK
jgi:hypothetical protein